MVSLGSERIVEKTAVAFYDVSDCVKSWGRRGILGGGLCGFVLGVAFMAIPHTDNVLTFGVVGTLIVGVVEGAVIAGAFGACAAALYSKGVLRGSATKFDQAPSTSRRIPEAGWRDGDIPLSDWPARRPHPGPAAVQPLPEVIGDANTAAHSPQNARTRLDTVDAWENGNTGP